MTTTVIPSIAVQEIYSGNKFTGAGSNGTHSEEALFRGRIQKWIAGTLGGEFAAPDLIGMRVEQVFWSMACSTPPLMEIFLVDDDDVEYLIHSATAVAGIYTQTNRGFLVPPTFKVRVKSDQNIDAVVPVAAEDTGVTGDGVSANYDIALVNGRVKPGTLSMTTGATVTFTDPASDGILVGTGGGGGSGTIDYLTGEISITLNTPSDFNAVNALATYDYNLIGRVGIVIGQGWGQPVPSQMGTIGSENYPPAMQRS